MTRAPSFLLGCSLALPALGSAGELPALDEPLKSGFSSPADAAVVVGIEDYAFVPDVPYAKRDAKAMYQFLIYTRGIPSQRVHLLDQGANREAIQRALETAKSEVGHGGTLWVYFAGHGAASPSTGDRLLLGDDVRGNADTLDARGLPLTEVLEMAAGEEHHALVVVDACYSGAGRGGEPIVEGRFAVPSYAVDVAPQVALWTAADENQTAMPLDGARQGAFTYLLVGAMRGWADGQLDGKRDGVVSAEEAYLYVQDGLRALQVRGQSPTWTGSERSEWTLVSSDQLEAPPVLDPTEAEPSVPEPAAAPQPTVDGSAPPTMDPPAVAGLGHIWTATDSSSSLEAYGEPDSDAYLLDNGQGCTSMLAREDGIWTESIMVGRRQCRPWSVFQIATDGNALTIRAENEADIVLTRQGAPPTARTGTWAGSMAFDEYNDLKQFGAAFGVGRAWGERMETKATIQLSETGGTVAWLNACTSSLRMLDAAGESGVASYQMDDSGPAGCKVRAELRAMPVSADKLLVIASSQVTGVILFGVLDRIDLDAP